jgi:hypothetical protein
VEWTPYGALAAARAAIRLVQHRELLPAHDLETQQVQVARGDAPTAAGAAVGVDIRQPS